MPLTLAVRPLLHFGAVYCSVNLRCSDSLPCGEMAPLTVRALV